MSTTVPHRFFLRVNGNVLAKAITDHLGITGMAVRRHLAVLEKEEFIAYTTVKQAMGRPMAVYRLTDKTKNFFPENYHSLAMELMSELEGESGLGVVNHLFDLRQNSMYKHHQQLLEGKDLEGKIAALAELQTSNGYMAAWERSVGGGYELTEYNCPIIQVAHHYNHACTCELRLFESLLGATVERTECLATDGKKCVYRIQPKPNPTQDKSLSIDR